MSRPGYYEPSSKWQIFKNIFWITITLAAFASCSYAIYEDGTPAGEARRTAIAEKQRIEHEGYMNDQLKHTPGMEDCSYHSVNGISIVRCPHSSTTTSYQCGKGCFQNNTVTEG